MKDPSFILTPCKPKKYIGAILSRLIVVLLSAYGIKVRCYWEHIGNKRENETRNFFNYLPSGVLRKAVTCQHWFFPMIPM
jgi:hypothetical protein